MTESTESDVNNCVNECGKDKCCVCESRCELSMDQRDYKNMKHIIIGCQDCQMVCITYVV